MLVDVLLGRVLVKGHEDVLVAAAEDHVLRTEQGDLREAQGHERVATWLLFDHSFCDLNVDLLCVPGTIDEKHKLVVLEVFGLESDRDANVEFGMQMHKSFLDGGDRGLKRFLVLAQFHKIDCGRLTRLLQQKDLDPKYFGSVLVLFLDLQEVDLDPEVVNGVCLLVHPLQLAQVELLHLARVD